MNRSKRAVVFGGSMAGLLAARVLANHFSSVTVLERDQFPSGPEARKGTPQARHIHVLLTAGRDAIEKLVPGAIDDIRAAGAEDYDAIADMEWISPSGRGVRFPSGLQQLGATRDLIDWCIRRRVLADDRIKLMQQVDAVKLQLDSTGRRIAGLEIDNRAEGTQQTLEADLVVDATGRGSRVPQWLQQHGYPVPKETIVNGFLGYATRIVEPPKGWNGDWKAFYVQCAPPLHRRGAVIAGIEGGRWIVTLAGGGKDHPPTDEEGFRDFARSLRDPRVAEAYEASQPLTPIVGTKSTENRIRHYELLTHRLEGLLVTGDAACAFNPVYGQGMTAAALGAQALEENLKQGITGIEERFPKALARSNRRPWVLATGEDYRYKEAEGPPPGWVMWLTHLYLDRVFALATRIPKVRQRLMEVIHLLRSPESLFTPTIFSRAMLPWV